MNNLKTNLHLLGPQGSGKGTQSEILAHKLGFLHISAGDLLRKKILSNNQFAHHLKAILDSGKLVPFGIIERVNEEEIKKYPGVEGIIFDGVLRNIDQVQAMSGLWSKLKLDEPLLVVLEISDEEAVKRISKRRVCPKCNYISFSNNNETKICPKCGETMIQRSDDTTEAILSRLKIYHQETIPVIAMFQSKNRVIVVDGSPSIETISEAIINSLRQRKIINF